MTATVGMYVSTLQVITDQSSEKIKNLKFEALELDDGSASEFIDCFLDI